MTRFVLAASRPWPGDADELALAAVAHGVLAAARWHAWLRRWGLLLSYALPRDPQGALRACLVVLASDDHAAERLAAEWGNMSVCRVAVLPLTAAGAGEISQ
jgi:hypothetical protein